MQNLCAVAGTSPRLGCACAPAATEVETAAAAANYCMHATKDTSQQQVFVVAASE